MSEKLFAVFAIGAFILFSAIGAAFLYQNQDIVRSLFGYQQQRATPSASTSPEARVTPVATSPAPSALPSPRQLISDYAALAQMPQALKQCVANNIGSKTLDAVIAGTEDPPQKLDQAFNACCVRQDILQSCVAFARKTGSFPEEALAFLEKISPYVAQGKTPGSCTSLEQCDSYCKAPANQQECLDFFYRVGVFPESVRSQIAAVVAQIKQALDQGPIALQTCIQKAVGTSTLEMILNGSKLPPQNISETFSSCAQNAQQQAEQALAALKQAIASSTPYFQQCVQSNVGGADQLDKIFAGTAAPPQNFADVWQGCVQADAQEQAKIFQAKLENLMATQPDTFTQCAVDQVGGQSAFEAIMATGTTTPELLAAFQACVAKLSP